jgi:signal transduction histidine kinase
MVGHDGGGDDGQAPPRSSSPLGGPDLVRLASYPEHNPNLVMELNLEERLIYLNPVARQRFPELALRGVEHPLLAGLEPLVADFRAGTREVAARQVDLGEAVFEQKICYIDATGSVLIYATDITALKRAEAAVELLAEQRRQLASRVIKAQEEERRRVAAELHDEAGQALTVLRISLELLARELGEASQGGLAAEVQESAALVQHTHERIRALAQGLRPPTLGADGLTGLLESTCRGFVNRTALAVDYQGLPVDNVSDDGALALFRFLQEALTNVLRHAQARRAIVRLREEAERLSLEVWDDGRGFQGAQGVSGEPRGGGMGLSSMAERLSLVGGGLEIASSPDRGSRLVAWVPLEPESSEPKR